MPEPFPVRVVKWMLILCAILVSPVYGAWVACGWIADRRGQQRTFWFREDAK